MDGLLGSFFLEVICPSFVLQFVYFFEEEIDFFIEKLNEWKISSKYMKCCKNDKKSNKYALKSKKDNFS